MGERRQMRALLDEHGGTPVPGEERLDVEDRRIDNDLTVRVYLPRERRTAVPVVLFFHGAGFTSGDLDTEHGMAVRTACDGECAVVSVDYRLAPEHPFPAALDDGWSAFHGSVELVPDAPTSRQAVAGRGEALRVAFCSGMTPR